MYDRVEAPALARLTTDIVRKGLSLSAHLVGVVRWDHIRCGRFRRCIGRIVLREVWTVREMELRAGNE
jgi:hypothetical protein